MGGCCGAEAPVEIETNNIRNKQQYLKAVVDLLIHSQKMIDNYENLLTKSKTLNKLEEFEDELILNSPEHHYYISLNRTLINVKMYVEDSINKPKNTTNNNDINNSFAEIDFDKEEFNLPKAVEYLELLMQTESNKDLKILENLHNAMKDYLFKPKD